MILLFPIRNQLKNVIIIDNLLLFKKNIKFSIFFQCLNDTIKNKVGGEK